MFKHYVLNYDHNKKKVEPFNIFDNWSLDEATYKEVKKYLRAPKKYKWENYCKKETIYGFEALCKRINSLIKWQEWGRYEYEMSVGEPFPKDDSEFQKIDCYYQCENNIEEITREVIWQFKHMQQ